MKVRKRILSCFLSFAIAVTMMCGLFTVSTYANNTPPKSTSELENRLEYVYTSHPSLKVGSYYPVTGGACWNYAREVFEYVFGIPAPTGFDTDTCEPAYSYTGNVYLVGCYNENGTFIDNEGNTKNGYSSDYVSVLSKAKKGDIIQGYKRYEVSHTMIVIDIDPENQYLELLDCNFKGYDDNHVDTHPYTFYEFTHDLYNNPPRYYYPRFCIWRSINYPPSFSNFSVSCTPGTSTTNTHFSWTKSENATYYNLKIWRGKLWEGDAYTIEAVSGLSYDIMLPAGYYEGYVDATNSTGDYLISDNRLSFTVEDNTSLTSISSCTISEIPDQYYTESYITPKPVIKSKLWATLEEGKDYTLRYINNKNVGTATIIITGIGAWKGVTTCTFKIVDSGSTASLVEPKIHLGKTTYNVGDNVTFTWDASPASSGLIGYWVNVDDPNGNMIRGGWPILNDESSVKNNTCTVKVSLPGEHTIVVYANTDSETITSYAKFTVNSQTTSLVEPKIHLGKTTYNVGDNVTFTWDASPASSGLTGYWVNVDDPNGNMIRGGWPILNDESSVKNNTCTVKVSLPGEHTIVVYANTDSETITSYAKFTVNSQTTSLVEPKIHLGKTTYNVGDNVTFTWDASPASSGLTGYWVNVDDPNGNMIRGGWPILNDESSVKNNTCTVKVSLPGEHTIVVYANTDSETITSYAKFTVNSQITSVADCTISAIGNQTYTGSVLTPAVTVKDGSKSLTKGTDYTVSYSNNTNVGTATVTVTGKGNYTGTKTTTFKIVAKNASNFSVSTISDQTYTGSALTPAVTVKDGSKSLTKGTDYTVSYSNNTNVGTATVTITGKGNYTGTKTATFKIVAKNASNFTVSAISDQTYTGSALTPAVTVKDGSTTLTKGTDYTVAYSNNTNIGTATITITGKGNYTGTKSATFNIVAKNASNFTVSAISNQTYTGSALTPAVTVIDGETVLVNGTDYTVSYSDNINVGTATVTITGKGNYTGTKSATFNIVAKNASNFTVSAISDQTYTGSALTPAVTVKDGETVLVNGTDYIVAYSDNINVGTATVTITGKGNYTGTKSATFNIVAKNASNFTVSAIADKTYTGSAIKPTITVKDGDKTLVKGTDYKVSYSNNINVGTATVKVVGYGNYTGTKTSTFKIVAKNASNFTVSAIPNQNYTGSALTPAVTVNDGETVLVNGTDYTVSYSDNINVGTATVTITGKGNYTGTKTTTFNIVSAAVPPTVTSITPGDGQVTLTWNAVDGATKYCVATYADGAYTVLNKTLKTNTYTITGLTNGTEYKFLVQAYVGKWSSSNTKYLVSATPKATAVTVPTVTVTEGDGQVTLTWDAVDGATKYCVATYADGAYTVLNKTLKTTTYTITGLTNGTEYKFLVQSYVGKWSSSNTKYLVSATPKAAAAAATEPTVTAVKASDGQVKLTWNAVDGATKYCVATYENGKYTVLSKTIKSTSYTAKNLTNNKTYRFLVQAYVNGKWSSTSAKYLVSATPGATTTIPTAAAIAGDGQVTLKWNAIPGATKYCVATYADGKYTVLSQTIKGTSYTATGLTNGKTVKFLVQSYTGKWSSKGTKYLVSCVPNANVPEVTEAVTADGKVTLKWEAVPDATKYCVATYADGKYTILNQKLTKTNITVSGLTNGTEYKFLVQAYVNGKWSAISTTYLVAATPNV